MYSNQVINLMLKTTILSLCWTISLKHWKDWYMIKYLTTILVQFHIKNSAFVKTNFHNTYFYTLITCVLLRNRLTVYIWIFQRFWQCPQNKLLMKLWSVKITDSYGYGFNHIYPIIASLYRSTIVHWILYLWNPVFHREVF